MMKRLSNRIYRGRPFLFPPGDYIALSNCHCEQIHREAISLHQKPDSTTISILEKLEKKPVRVATRLTWICNGLKPIKLRLSIEPRPEGRGNSGLGKSLTVWPVVNPNVIHTFVLLFVIGASLYLTGCVMTSRYKIESKKEAVPQDSLKEVSEESTENDRIVNPDTVLPEIDKIPVNTELNRSTMMKGISGMIGTPYSFSGTDENGIDCSGFTAKIFGQIGKTLPHSTVEQYRMTIPVSEDDKRFGDLVFFNTTGESPSHVGIFLGGGYFAHASVSAGVTISSLESTYYKRRFVGMRRLP